MAHERLWVGLVRHYWIVISSYLDDKRQTVQLIDISSYLDDNRHVVHLIDISS